MNCSMTGFPVFKFMSIKLVMPSNCLILCCPLLSCSQSFPASGSFPMSQLFASGDQSTGVSASASVLTMNIQDWFPLGWTGCTSLQSKEFSRVFSSTTVRKHQFFSALPSLLSSSHIHTWLLESCQSFSSKEQASFHFMPAVTMILVFFIIEFKAGCFTFLLHPHQEAL